MIAELLREAGLLFGVFGVLDALMVLWTKDERIDFRSWMLVVNLVTWVLIISGILLEMLRPDDDE